MLEFMFELLYTLIDWLGKPNKNKNTRQKLTTTPKTLVKV